MKAGYQVVGWSCLGVSKPFECTQPQKGLMKSGVLMLRSISSNHKPVGTKPEPHPELIPDEQELLQELPIESPH
jgi:hypothetical protein